MQFYFSVHNLRFEVCKTILLACNAVFNAFQNIEEFAEPATADSKSEIRFNQWFWIYTGGNW